MPMDQKHLGTKGIYTHEINGHFWSTFRMKKPSYPTFPKPFGIIFMGSGSRSRGHIKSYAHIYRECIIIWHGSRQDGWCIVRKTEQVSNLRYLNLGFTKEGEVEFHHLVNKLKIFLALNFFTLTCDIKYESHINEQERKPIGFGILHRKHRNWAWFLYDYRACGQGGICNLVHVSWKKSTQEGYPHFVNIHS